MNTVTAIRAVAAAAYGQPVVFASGNTALVARRVADRPNHFYLNGSSGFASSIGIGVALHAQHTTVVVDDTDSLLANLAALVTAGMLADLPLVHIVLDGAPRASAGGGATPSGRTDLCALAMAVGYPRTYTIERTEKLAELMRKEIARCPSPVFVRCLLADSTWPALARIGRNRHDADESPDDPPDWLSEAA
jgi:thiamine pyrophosphate-dependent acetolactate synthase large subunit-like protein